MSTWSAIDRWLCMSRAIELTPKEVILLCNGEKNEVTLTVEAGSNALRGAARVSRDSRGSVCGTASGPLEASGIHVYSAELLQHRDFGPAFHHHSLLGFPQH